MELTERDIYQGSTNLETLRTIAERHQHAKIQVARKSVTVDAQTAHMLCLVHDALNAGNKVKFVALLAHSQATFRKMVDFSWNHVQAAISS